ncbi:MAG: hypothetical protein WC806_06205 [Candidatus Gracilibacteria bacterium]|jgi:hypothetical protein
MRKQTKILLGVLVVVVIAGVSLFTANGGLGKGIISLNPTDRANSISVAGQYPVSTNPILFQWKECDDNQIRNISRGEEENIDILRQCVNYLPSVFCKAKVLGEGSDVDTDKDGIKNNREFFMGLNPCEKYSVGGSVADGDFDYDGDRILNKNDTDPICNMNGLYTPDCV